MARNQSQNDVPKKQQNAVMQHEKTCENLDALYFIGVNTMRVCLKVYSIPPVGRCVSTESRFTSVAAECFRSKHAGMLPGQDD